MATSKSTTTIFKSPTQQPPRTSTSSSSSSHTSMVELKSKILSSLSKLSDRDTHHLALEDLDRLIRSLPSPDAVPTFLSALLSSDHPSSPAARRDSIRLIATLCGAQTDACGPHLPKILSHIARRLKDPSSDSSLRDACRDATYTLASLYLKPFVLVNGDGSNVSNAGGVFVKAMMEVMGEQSRAAQAGGAACLAKAVEGAGPGPGAVAMFGKLSSRVCKLLAAPSFFAKGPLLSVIASLAQVGAISPQNMQQVLQSIRDCLENSDWAARKAAADTLSILSSHSSHLIGDGAAPTVAALEACRFDKVKPVRDSMVEALQLWKNIAGEDAKTEEPKDGKGIEGADTEEKVDPKRSSSSAKSESAKDSSQSSSPTNNEKGKGTSILEKAAVILKKRAPTSTDKELNPEFFQKLERRNTDDLPVEVVVPHQQCQSQGEDEPEVADCDSTGAADDNGSVDTEGNQAQGRTSSGYQSARDKWADQRGLRTRDQKARAPDGDDKVEAGGKDPSASRSSMLRSDASVEGPFMNNKSNWLAIQRQLSLLERQQASLMNMLQDFMGGSHDSMVTLENRVRGLERVVEEMARDLSISGRRGGSSMLGFDSSPGRSAGKYNGFHEYSSAKFGRGSDGRMGFAERFFSADNMASGVRSPSWRSDPEPWDSYAYPRTGMNARRGLGAVSADGRAPRTERGSDQMGLRRAWDKGQGPFRLGEGPSARSAWQASKDEATLEAIRVAGEDNGSSRAATRVAIPELDGEALNDDNQGDERGPLWESWTRAMDSLHVGDMDSAYAEVLSTSDAELLVKLMEQTGPVLDQLSNEVGNEILHAVGQFLVEESLYDMALSWLQQLTDLVMENGVEFLGIPLEGKKEILLDLHDASAIELPEDWEGATPEQIMKQLASSWRVDLQQLIS